MASLIEELITIVNKEVEQYESLVTIASEKTKVIIENDLPKLQTITQKEQSIIDIVSSLEHKRMDIIHNIATVLGRADKILKIKDIIAMLDNQPKEQEHLSILHDRFKASIQQLMDINNRNKSLITQSLEMIEFNMNFIQSTRMSPGNNNYSKGAKSIDASFPQTRMFDTKQ